MAIYILWVLLSHLKMGLMTASLPLAFCGMKILPQWSGGLCHCLDSGWIVPWLCQLICGMWTKWSLHSEIKPMYDYVIENLCLKLSLGCFGRHSAMQKTLVSERFKTPLSEKPTS